MTISQILAVAASRAPWWSFLSKLWNSLTAMQWAAAISAAILTLGAVIEYQKELKLLALLALKWFCRKSTPFDRCVFNKTLVKSIGSILVVLGIAGEVLFESRTFIVEDRQEEQTEQQTAQLKEKAANEELARAEIEAKVAWRSLTDKQKGDIGAALCHFPKTTVAVGYEGIDAESASFASDIADALQNALVLNVVPEDGLLHFETPRLRKGHIIAAMDTGVLVVPTKDATSESLASAISTELNNRGFDARIGKPESRVRVDVGPRPIGAQGEYKLQLEREAKTKIAASN